MLRLASEGQVGRRALEHEAGEALGVGVTPGMALALAVTESLGSGRSAHAVMSGSNVDLLVLRADLGEQERSMLADGRRSSRRSGEASAD